MEATRDRPRAHRANGGLKHIQTWIDAEVWHRVRVAAIERQTTVAALVTEAITRHLEPRTRRPS